MGLVDPAIPAPVADWLRRRTSLAADWDPAALRTAKATTGARVSVVLPALDEERTIGAIVSTLRQRLMGDGGLIDEIVVMDSGSTDQTVAVARAAGAVVRSGAAVLPRLGVRAGKGEMLWKSLAATSGDILVFVDSDLVDFGAHVVTGLLGPLLVDTSVVMVKGCYRRPLPRRLGGPNGGRVTELVARPLLNMYWPELAGVAQPLGGEYAARRRALEAVPFTSGYGVDIGLLLDIAARWGVGALAQVDLGVRQHTPQGDAALGRMAAQVWQAVLARLQTQGRLTGGPPPSPWLVQFPSDRPYTCPERHDVSITHRPPMATVPEYRAAAPASAGERRCCA